MKIECGKYDSQFDIIPNVCMYVHTHWYDFREEKEAPWHFHLSIQWLMWYIELRIGRDE